MKNRCINQIYIIVCYYNIIYLKWDGKKGKILMIKYNDKIRYILTFKALDLLKLSVIVVCFFKEESCEIS